MKIAETIYTPFQNGHFWPVLTVSCNFRNFFFTEKKQKNQLNNWKKPHTCYLNKHNSFCAQLIYISKYVIYRSLVIKSYPMLLYTLTFYIL